jgi:hypothetical protein
VKEIRLCYDSLDAFAADCEANLRKGRAFVVGANGLAVLDRCTVVIVHPETDARIDLVAEAVWIGPEGTGVSFVDMDGATKAKLDEFAKSPEPTVGQGETDGGATGAKEGAAGGAGGAGHGKGPRNLHERMRTLSIREREEISRHGSLAERVALERAYGGVVWEGLLQNPSISTAEVARIARNGTLPKPLVQVIVNNAGWVSVPEVQRALLTNPRCSGPHLERVVRAIPSSELKRMAVNCPYRSEVRSVVRQYAQRTS